MTEILINGCGLSTMCRLCLSRDVILLDIFFLSPEMMNQVVNVIVTCAPVKITKNDGMPNFVCKLCFTRLKKIRDFQMQIVQSDKTLRRYLEQLGGPDSHLKKSCSIPELSEKPSIYETNVDVSVNCDSLELQDVIDTMNDNSLSFTECANETLSNDDHSEISSEDTKIGIGAVLFDQDTSVNWKEREPPNFKLVNKIKDEVVLKSEIQTDEVLVRPEYVDDIGGTNTNDGINVKICESLEIQDVFEVGGLTNDNSLFSTECADDISLKDGYSEITCEDTKIGFGDIMLDEKTSVNWKDEEPGKFNSADKIKREVSSNSEHQSNVLIRPGLNYDTGNAPLSGNDSEISCKDTKTCVGPSTGKFAIPRTANVKRDKREENNKSIFTNSTKHKGNKTIQKTFNCGVCDKYFSTSGYLKVHKRTHTGVKPYKCDVCNKNFTQLWYLKVHKRAHAGLKPFKCDVCNKSFINSSNFNVHKRIHAAVKPYKLVNKIKDEVVLKSEIQTDEVLVRPEYVDDIGGTNTNDGINVKICESLKLQDVFEADGLTNDNSLFSTECADDISLKDGYSEITCEDTKIGFGDIMLDVNWKHEEPGKFNLADKIKREVSSNSEHQSDVLIRPGCNNDTGNAPLSGNGSEISCKDTMPCIGPTTEKFAIPRTASVKRDKREENNKNISTNSAGHKGHKTIKKTFNCGVCDKYFSTLGNLNVHKRTHTGVKPYKCDICNQSFINSSNLNVHNRTHHGVKPYKCDVCNKNFTKLGYFNVHKRGHAGVKPYTCDVCNKSFTNSSDLKVHKRTHTGVKPYKCVVCNKTFTKLGYFKVHKRTHTCMKPYKCDVCNKNFTKLDYFNVHKRGHSGVKPYTCDVCNKSFTNSNHLKFHERTHTGVKPYKCDVCNHRFISSSNLIVHKRTHTGVKPYKCDVCNHSCANSSNLNVHKRIHTVVKPFTCVVCNKSFTQLWYLKVHKRGHAGVKPYKCDVCNKNFNTSNTLNLHKRTHAGVKPYKCDVCNKSFTQLCHLNNHKNPHTAVKAYECDVCNKSFISSSNLILHKRVHTGVKPYN